MSGPVNTRSLETALGMTPGRTFGYLASPAAIVAALVEALAARASRTVEHQVSDLGGIETLRSTCGVLDAWIRYEIGRTALGTGGQIDRRMFEGHELLTGLRFRDNVIQKGHILNTTGLIELSAVLPGIHVPGTLPVSSVWRRKLADAVSRLLDGIPAPGPDDILITQGSYSGDERVGIRSNHPMLADVWTMQSTPRLEHAPDALIEAAAARIAMVLRRVHTDSCHSARVADQERRIEAELRAALGETASKGPVVTGTRIHCVHFEVPPPRDGCAHADDAYVPMIGHCNVTTRAILPNDLLVEEEVVLSGNLHHRLELFDLQRQILRLRKRGETMREGGIRFSPVLKRCMERDGVHGDDLVEALGKGVTGPARLGFGRDVKKVLVRAGVVDIHLELAPRVTIRAGSVHMPGMDLADTLLDQLVDGPLARLVDHPMVPDAVITRMTRAKTGSLIARTDLAA